MKRPNRPERPKAAELFDVDANEKAAMGINEIQPIFPVEEPEDPSKPPAAKIATAEEFLLEEQNLIAKEKSDRELAALRARMDKYMNESGATLIDFDKSGSASEANFEDNDVMGRIDEVLDIIKHSGLDSETVKELLTTMFSLIFEVATEEIDQGKIDQIIAVIENSELEENRKQELILELKSMIASAMMDMDGNQS